MNRAVFDTNVVVSGFLSPSGPPGRIVEWLRSGALVAVIDARIFNEYAEVMVRPAFALPVGDVALVLDAIRGHAEWIETAIDIIRRPSLPDPDDAPFWECAQTAGVPLVTGNIRHFPKTIVGGLSVLTPAQFVDRVVHTR